MLLKKPNTTQTHVPRMLNGVKVSHAKKLFGISSECMGRNSHHLGGRFDTYLLPVHEELPPLQFNILGDDASPDKDEKCSFWGVEVKWYKLAELFFLPHTYRSALQITQDGKSVDPMMQFGLASADSSLGRSEIFVGSFDFLRETLLSKVIPKQRSLEGQLLCSHVLQKLADFRS